MECIFDFNQKNSWIIFPSDTSFILPIIFLLNSLKNFEFFGRLLPSQQILVPRPSWGRHPPTSPWRLLKILFDRPRDVTIWRRRGALKWRPGDALSWRSRNIPGRFIWDVPRTFSGRPIEDLQSTQTWMSQFF